jgi:hypothetical protein
VCIISGVLPLRRGELAAAFRAGQLTLLRELKDAGAVAIKEIFDFGVVNALLRSELDNSLVA